MAKKKAYRLGDLQLKILKILWDRGEANVAEVHQLLWSSERLAYTTVATMLRKMEARGLVRHRADDRRFLYTAAATADEVTRGMSHDMVDRLFEGSLADMVSHLLQTRDVSRQELAELERLIANRKKQL